MFDATYQALENCLNDYLKKKNGGGWTKEVIAFQTDKLPHIIAQRSVQTLIQETNKFANSLYSFFDWMPCAAGSTLQIDLKCLLLKVEKEYRQSLPRPPEDPFIVVYVPKHSAPILIPKTFPRQPTLSLPPLEASPIEIRVNSQPFDCVKNEYRNKPVG
jgi:hypothetical protein